MLATLPDRAALAIVIADIQTREVRALIGGEWGSETRAGALDLTRAVRSPGSALKPFLYAMAFERGIVTPSTVIADLPRHFGAYAPENFSHGFAGRVTAADALRMSLNLPAVALLDQVGALRFASALKLAGAAPRLPRGADPSLPLALGGAGTTLRDMTALYATIADGGRSLPLRLTPAPSAASGAGRPRGDGRLPATGAAPTPGGPAEAQQAIERRAADAVAAILVQRFPDGGPAGVAWKTGTSWGGRDAWAMGFDGAACRRGLGGATGWHGIAGGDRAACGAAGAGARLLAAAGGAATGPARGGRRAAPGRAGRPAAAAVSATRRIAGRECRTCHAARGGRAPAACLPGGWRAGAA